jgi:hypothetical protein
VNSVTLKNTAKHSIIELFLPSTAHGAAMLNEASQVPQSDGGQQGSGSFSCSRIDFQLGDEQIGRGPWKSYNAPESQPHHYPGNSLSPEDASYTAD